MDKQKQLILNENLTRVMWQLSWPAVVAMVLYGMNNFLDGIFVGHLISNTALAAVGVAYPLAQLAQAMGSLIGTGIGTSLSIWIGENQTQKLKKMFGTVHFLSLISSVLLSLPAYIYAEELIYMMGGRGEIAVLGTEYFKVTLLSNFFWIHGLALNMMIRAEGKMKTAAWMIAIGLVIDVLLKPVFIDTFGWGVSGAAWATNVSMIIYTLSGIWYYSKGKASFVTKFWSFLPNRQIIKETFALGMPAFIMMAMIVVQNIVVFNALAKYGTAADITFYTAVNRFFILLNTPLWGLMRALQPVTGMNFGAGNYERAKKSYVLFSFTGLIILLPFWAIVMFFPSDMLSIMIPDVTFSMNQLTNFRIYMSVLLTLPFIFMAMVWFPSVKNGKPASIVGILRQLVFYVPVMLIVPSFFGVDSVYWASAIIDWSIFLLVIFLVRINFNRLTKSEKKLIFINNK